MDWRWALRRERDLCGVAGFLLEALQVVDGLARERSGREDRFLVAAKDLEPTGEVLSMIEPGRIGDAKLGAQKSCSKLGHKFLKTIGFIAEALAMLAVEAMGAPAQ